MIEFHWGKPRKGLQLRTSLPYSSVVTVSGSGAAAYEEAWRSEASEITGRWGATFGRSVFIGIVSYGVVEQVSNAQTQRR